MKKKIIFAIIPVVVLIVIFAALATGSEEIVFYETQKIDLKETVLTAGKIEFSRTAGLSFGASGIMEETAAAEGSFLRTGEIAARLENTAAETALASAEAEYARASAALQKIGEQVPAAEKKLESEKAALAAAEKNLADSRKLAEAGALSDDGLENIRNIMLTRSYQAEAAESALSSLLPGGADYESASAAQKTAAAAVAKARENLADTFLEVDGEGTVLEIFKNPGEYISPGTTVLEYGVLPLRAAAELDEKEFPQISPGKKVFLSLQALPEKIIETEISEVSPKIDERNGTFTVYAPIPEDKSGFMAAGATVNMEILLNEEKDVIPFPRDMALDTGEGIFVFAWKGTAAEKVKITPEKILDRWIISPEITAGMKIIFPEDSEKTNIRLGEVRSDI